MVGSVGLQRAKADRPRQLASINTHCQVRGVTQFSDRVYVVCAGYGTVEVFSASDCRWLDRVVISGLDDPHDLQVASSLVVSSIRISIIEVRPKIVVPGNMANKIGSVGRIFLFSLTMVLNYGN